MKSINNKKLPNLPINIKQFNYYVPKTDRYTNRIKDQLHIPIINSNNKSKKIEDYKTLSSKAERATYLKTIAKKYSTSVRNSFYKLLIKKQLNKKSQKEINNSIKKITHLSNSKKKEKKQNKENENIIIPKRFSVVIPKNIIKNNYLEKSSSISINNNSEKDFFKYNRTRSFKSSKSLKNNISELFKKSKRFSVINRVKNIREKEKSPFEVEEEDKMFKGTIQKKKMKKKKKQKKIKIYYSKDAPLNRVYKKIPYVISQLDKIKKLKNDMSLIKYQKTLLDLGNKIFDREINNKLNQKFIEIRKATEKKYDYLEKEIDLIEDREKTIIRQINTQQNFFKRIMINNNKSNLIYGVSNKIDFFPNIKFHHTQRIYIYK